MPSLLKKKENNMDETVVPQIVVEEHDAMSNRVEDIEKVIR